MLVLHCACTWHIEYNNFDDMINQQKYYNDKLIWCIQVNLKHKKRSKITTFSVNFRITKCFLILIAIQSLEIRTG